MTRFLPAILMLLFAGPAAAACVVGTDQPTLAAAVANCGGNVTIEVPIDQTVSTNIAVTASGVEIICTNRAVITAIGSGRLNFTGSSRSAVRDCEMVGPGSGGTSSQAVVFSGGGNNSFTGNRVHGYGDTGWNGTVEFIDQSNLLVSDNIISDVRDFGILALTATASRQDRDVRIVGNRVENGILVHSQGTNSRISEVVVSGNTVRTGLNGQTIFCVEIGGFATGATLSGAVISGNTCDLAAAGTHGGYSVGGSGVAFVTITGNTFNSNWNAFTIGAIEVAGYVYGATVTGNHLFVGNGGMGIAVNAGGQDVTVSGNTVQGYCLAAGCAGIFASTSVAANLINITIVGNTIAAAFNSVGRGVWVQCNHASAVCFNYHIANNTITTPDQPPGSVGVLVSNHAAIAMAGVLIGPNIIVGAPVTGVRLEGNTVNGVCLLPGINGAAQAVVGAPASSCR